MKVRFYHVQTGEILTEIDLPALPQRGDPVTIVVLGAARPPEETHWYVSRSPVEWRIYTRNHGGELAIARVGLVPMPKT